MEYLTVTYVIVAVHTRSVMSSFWVLRVLNGKAIDIREKGKEKKRKVDPITEEEEEQLWLARVLGGDSPSSLDYTVWYLLSQRGL